LNVISRQLTLRDAYRAGIASAWNALVESGKIDYAAVRTMTGYLLGAVVAFRVTGDEPVARLMETAGACLLEDWRSYEACVRELVADLDSLPE
jgi:hypothetical protein